MPDFSGFKLGRRDNRPGLPRLPRLTELAPALPEPPAAAGYGVRETGWGMLANDQVGDCYPAAMMHAVMSMTRWSEAEPFQATDALTLALYSAITGYDPADQATDQGTEPAAAIAYWQRTGIDLGGGVRNVLAGAAGLHAGSWDDLRRALAWAGMALVSWTLPVSAQNQQIWDVVADDGGVWGGHETLAIFYNPATVRVVTWGMEMLATRAFVERYMTGGIMPIDHDSLRASGRDPMALDWSQLQSARAVLSAAIG